MIYFTADTHFNHINIIKFCDRPYELIDEMNEALIENWNSVVGKADEIYHLGDFGWGDNVDNLDILRRLNGTKYLVKGNHDWKLLKDKAIRSEFEWIKDYNELELDDNFFVMCHYPFRTWNRDHYGAINLFGHSHGNTDPIGNQLDVGVDLHEYRPISINEVVERFDEK